MLGDASDEREVLDISLPTSAFTEPGLTSPGLFIAFEPKSGEDAPNPTMTATTSRRPERNQTPCSTSTKSPSGATTNPTLSNRRASAPAQPTTSLSWPTVT